jgi:hypothetical protein
MRKAHIRFAIAGLSVVAIALAFSVCVPIARSDSETLGGRVVLTGGAISNTNPCNNLSAASTNGLTATAVVAVVSEDANNQTQVFVPATYDGQGLSDGTNSYTVHGSAHAIYDTLAGGGYYDLPMNLDYDSVNNHTLSFREISDVFVVVNQKQQPTNIPSTGRVAICDAH